VTVKTGRSEFEDGEGGNFSPLAVIEDWLCVIESQTVATLGATIAATVTATVTETAASTAATVQPPMAMPIADGSPFTGFTSALATPNFTAPLSMPSGVSSSALPSALPSKLSAPRPAILPQATLNAPLIIVDSQGLPLGMLRWVDLFGAINQPQRTLGELLRWYYAPTPCELCGDQCSPDHHRCDQHPQDQYRSERPLQDHQLREMLLTVSVDEVQPENLRDWVVLFARSRLPDRQSKQGFIADQSTDRSTDQSIDPIVAQCDASNHKTLSQAGLHSNSQPDSQLGLQVRLPQSAVSPLGGDGCADWQAGLVVVVDDRGAAIGGINLEKLAAEWGASRGRALGSTTGKPAPPGLAVHQTGANPTREAPNSEYVEPIATSNPAARSEMPHWATTGAITGGTTNPPTPLMQLLHRLHSPLMTITGLATLLQDPRLGELSAKQRSYAQIIQRSGQQIAQELEWLERLARLQAGRVGFSPERLQPEDLVELCEQTWQTVVRCFNHLPTTPSVGHAPQTTPQATPQTASPTLPPDRLARELSDGLDSLQHYTLKGVEIHCGAVWGDRRHWQQTLTALWQGLLDVITLDHPVRLQILPQGADVVLQLEATLKYAIEPTWAEGKSEPWREYWTEQSRHNPPPASHTRRDFAQTIAQLLAAFSPSLPAVLPAFSSPAASPVASTIAAPLQTSYPGWQYAAALARAEGGDLSVAVSRQTITISRLWVRQINPDVPPVHLGDRRLLIFDREPLRLAQLIQHGRRLGWYVAIAHHAGEVLDKVQRLHPNVLLLDYTGSALTRQWLKDAIQKNTQGYGYNQEHAQESTQGFTPKNAPNNAPQNTQQTHKTALIALVPTHAPAVPDVPTLRQPINVAQFTTLLQQAVSVPPVSLTVLVIHHHCQPQRKDPLTQLNEVLHRHHYRTIEVRDLHQARLFVEIWQPDVILLNVLDADRENSRLQNVDYRNFGDRVRDPGGDQLSDRGDDRIDPQQFDHKVESKIESMDTVSAITDKLQRLLSLHSLKPPIPCVIFTSCDRPLGALELGEGLACTLDRTLLYATGSLLATTTNGLPYVIQVLRLAREMVAGLGASHSHL